jgi:site-specific recombinase XerD
VDASGCLAAQGVQSAPRAPVTRPYDLRHSYASLMVQAGYSAVELAAELGHSPTLTLDTYAHVFSEFARGERIDPHQAVAAARDAAPARLVT